MPAFPEENPDQVALATWLDKWDAFIASQGYMPMLSGKDPTGVVHLIEQDLSDYPVIAPAADGSNAQQVSTRAAKRADVIHQNKVRRAQKAQVIADHKNRLALRLISALRPHAGLRLKKLQSDHIVSGTINCVDAIYDGIEMYKSLSALRTAALSKPKRDKVKNDLKVFESAVLSDGCSGQEYMMKVNTFVRDINPYLDRPYEKESLTEYIVELMPPSLTSDGLAILRELEREGESDDHMKAQGLCETVVEAHAKSKGVAKTPLAAAVPGLGSKEISGKEMKKLMAGPDAAWQAALQARPVSAAALAVMRKNGNGNGGAGKDDVNPRTGRAANGKRCPSGTCSFPHAGECWRDPRVKTADPGLFTKPGQLERIEADRKANAAAHP